MRSHDAARIRETCRAALRPVLASLGEPAPRVVRDDTDGWVNVCFFVDDRWVVRFNARDTHLPKFARERRAYELLRQHGLPVPDVVHLDDSRRHVPYEVLVASLLPGTSLERSWPELDPGDRSALAHRAGELLAGVHEVRVEAFGSLVEEPGEVFSSWPARVEHRMEGYLQDAARHAVFDDATAARFRALPVAARSALGAVRTPRLVHADFHFGNLLHVGREITGIVDLEWAHGGDPAEDLVVLPELEEICPGSRDALVLGHRSRRPADPGEAERRVIYRALRNVELTVEAHRHFPLEEAAEYRRASLAQLDRAESALA